MILLFVKHYKRVRWATLAILLGTAVIALMGYEELRDGLLLAVLLGAMAVVYAFCYFWPFQANAIEEMNRRLLRNQTPRKYVVLKFFFWFGFVGSVLPILRLCMGAGADQLLMAMTPALGLLAGSSHVLHKLLISDGELPGRPNPS